MTVRERNERPMTAATFRHSSWPAVSRSMRLRTAPSMVAGTSRVSRSPTTAVAVLHPDQAALAHGLHQLLAEERMAGDAVVDEAGELERQLVDAELAA